MSASLAENMKNLCRFWPDKKVYFFSWQSQDNNTKEAYIQNLIEKDVLQAVSDRRFKSKNLRTSLQESTDALPFRYSRLVGANKT